MSRAVATRRALLGALGASAALVPFVPLLDARGESARAPKRLMFFFSSNGTIRESWLPTMGDAGLELGPILAPLERFKSKLLVIDGLCHKVIVEKSNRSGHTAGMNTALTGRTNKIPDPSQPLRSFATGISLDQHLAARMAAGTKLQTIECGIQVEPYSKDFAALSYRGELQPIMPESNPSVVRDRLFGGLGTSREASPHEALADRQRVLDAVSRELEAMGRRVSKSDRMKMEAHVAALRAIEHSLTTGFGSAALGSCAPPGTRRLDPWANDEVPALAKAQMDLMAMALACDLTRIGTLQFGRGGCAHRFTWLGPEFQRDPEVDAASMAKGFHAIAHHETEPTNRAKLVRIHTWYAEQLAYFLEKLDAIPEGDGTLLDHTTVVWMNELGTGGSHSHENLPFVIAGGGHFQTGRLVAFPGEPHNRLLVSLCHAMGVEESSFGDPDYGKAGPLPGLTA